MPDHDPKPIVYFVNGERETSPARELTVRRILESAGFTPATDYVLRSENPPHDYGSNYDLVIELHNEQRFQALHNGPTPTS